MIENTYVFLYIKVIMNCVFSTAFGPVKAILIQNKYAYFQTLSAKYNKTHLYENCNCLKILFNDCHQPTKHNIYDLAFGKA